MVFLSISRVSGHSMEPNFKMNQTIIVSGLPYLFSSPQIGDVIVFKKEKLILKRIKKIFDKKYLVAGDNKYDSKDFGWIEKKDIYGKVVLTV